MAKSYLDKSGLTYFWSKLKSIIGIPEAPYKEVEWVESNGKQFVYLDWKPPIATWGFEADFIIRNAFSTSVGAWNASTNANGYGYVFGTTNWSGKNDIEFGTYNTTGYLRIGNSTNYSSSGTFKTDKTRQSVKLIGTTLTKANGSTATVTRASETANAPYCNMTVFAVHNGIRCASYGNVAYPSTTRIYSLKFYEGTTVVVNLVGAIRKSDGVTGLYDKVAGHFYPAPGMTYGNDIGDLGSTETVLETAKNTIVQGTANNITHRRMWTVNVPTLSKLVDGQKLSITPMYTVVASVESDLATTEDSGNNTCVYLKLTLADGNTTDWIPCYYMGATRLTSHYGAGHPILFTYRENAFYGATDTGSGNAIMRGMFADPNYNTDRYYDVYSDTVIAGANGIKRYILCMQDSTGKWTSIVNEANNANATGKTCYTGGLRLGKVLYHSAGAEYASGANSGTMWQTYAFDARYSMNGIANASSTTLQMRKPFYLVGTIHSDGLFYLDTTKWWTQTEPTTEDGKVYLLVGWAYSSYYAVYLAAHNPAYVFKNGKIQELTNTHVVDADVPANAKFTDTVTTATTSGSGNAVTAITASNGALTVTKGTTFLTSHQDISGKADKSATVSTVTWDSTNKKLTKTINGSTTDVVTASTLRTGLNVADGAEVNQNAFSNVKVGSTTVAADSKTDTLELAAGTNITLTPDATNDKVTIAATDTTYGVATGSKDGLMSSSDFTKLSGIATGAEANQNAFSNVKVGSTTVAADAKTDTLELAAGTNITLTPDATNDKVTIATSAEVNQNAFSNVKVGSTTVAADAKTDTLELVAGSNVTLTPDATNDKVTIAATDTTYGVATGSKDGLMSSSDFTKLSGIATGAEVNQNAFSNVKVGSTTVAADSKTDTLELAAGTNITLTPDATNDKVTIATSAEVNQNAFSNVKVGSTTVAADAKTDTLELAAGTNITLTPDATNDKVTIAATDTKYSAGTGLSLSGTTFSNAIKTRNDLMSLQSKTYTGVIGSTNDDAGTYLYCMKVLPTSYYSSWEITYRVTATITGVSEANGSGYETSIVHICGMRDTYSAYSTWNEVSNTSYRPYYYHCLYRAKSAGITSGYGHLLGISLRYSYNPVTAANARTVSFDLMETKNCTVTFFDSPTKYASCPGTGTTNYSTQTAFDGTTQGITMTGDRNDPNYTVRNYYGCRTTYTAMYRYQFCATRKDRSLLPMNTVNNSVATNKTLTTEAFDPFGDFLFWNSTTTYSAGANVGDGWYAQYVADFRYSFNIGGYNTASTLVARKPVYLVCTPQSDGTVKLHSAPLAQELPTTEDNKLYIYIGQAYPDTYPYRVYISILHPIYWYKDGAVRLYTGSHYSAGTGISISTDNVITNSGITDISWDSDSGMLKKTKNGSVSIVTPLSTAALTGSYDDLSDKPTISTLGGIPSSQKAAANGVASLGSDGKVPGAQLPDNANLSAVEARVTALEGLLNVVESWTPSSGYSIASSSSWSAALGSKAFHLAKGTYIVMFGADFSSNASGYRMVQINTSAAGNRYTPSSPPVNGNNTRLMGTVLLQPTATTNYYMYVFQNSGATLTVTPWARIIKIG